MISTARSCINPAGRKTNTKSVSTAKDTTKHYGNLSLDGGVIAVHSAICWKVHVILTATVSRTIRIIVPQRTKNAKCQPVQYTSKNNKLSKASRSKRRHLSRLCKTRTGVPKFHATRIDIANKFSYSFANTVTLLNP